MELLPTPDERDWLIEELARLVVEVGSESLIAAPVVPPDDRSFPDRWTPDIKGVYRLTRRLMTYAGLGALEVSLDIDQYAKTTTRIDERGRFEVASHSGTAAWFAGIHGRVSVFGVDVHQLKDPQVLAGTLAHEVAHAYRWFEDLRRPQAPLEERLTDLTTIFIGFGILTCNASLRFVSGVADRGATFWRSSSGGYLTPQSMSYALALQAVARGDDERVSIARQLDTTQAACFRAACASLDRDETIRKLGLGLPSLWPKRRALPEVVIDDSELVVDEPSAPPDGPVDHHPVFRLAVSAAHPVWMRGALALGLAVLVAGAALHSITIGILGLLATLVVAGFLAAIGIGPRRRWDACADPECGVAQPPDAFVCPGCTRLIAGRVTNASQRLEAAEEWERSQP